MPDVEEAIELAEQRFSECDQNPCGTDPTLAEAQDDARLVAEYWMRYGFFRSVRCDKQTEALDGTPLITYETVFYAQKLDGDVFWRRLENGRWTEYVKEERK